jgi:hypothetical protein
VLAFQDFAQVEEIHGEKLTRSMASMCGAIVVAQMQQGDTADAVAKMLGTRQIERESRSTSSQGRGPQTTTVSRVREETAVYKASELASRLGAAADRKGVVCALIHGGDAFEMLWPMHPRRKLRPQHVPAKWIAGAAPFKPSKPVDILSFPPPEPEPAAEALRVPAAAALGASGLEEGLDEIDMRPVAPRRLAGAPIDAGDAFDGSPIDPKLIEQLLRGLDDEADESTPRP